MRACLRGLALLALPAASIAAQVVRGSVSEQSSQRGVAGVVVVLLDASGRRAAGVLTDERGRFAVLAPSAGRYTIRTERIGFRATTSEAITLAAGETREVALATSMIPVQLSAMRIVRSTSCVVRGQAGRDVSDVWEEVRKALYATAISQQTPFEVHVRRYSRSVHARDGRVLKAESSEQRGVARRPFASIPASRLSQLGYIVKTDTGVVYFAPDADVLLAEEFVADHCLQLTTADAKHAGQIGLRFEPVKGRSIPDVRGVLWVDAATSELRTLDFSYTKDFELPRSVDPDRFGGTIAFHRLPSGWWIVKQWVIRMPELEALGGADPRRASGAGETYGLRAIRETGGEVLEASTPQGQALLGETRATLTGVVIDSSRQLRPLAGARVVLDGTAFTATTDSSGRFLLPDVPDGVYGVAFLHSRLDSLGYTAPVVPVTLRTGTDATVTLAIPSMATLLSRVCPKAEQPAGMAAVRGTVRYAGVPGKARGARVTVTWPAMLQSQSANPSFVERTLTVAADDDGRYIVCGLPEGTKVTIRARLEGSFSERTSMSLAADVLNTRDLEVRVATDVAAAPSGPPAATQLPTVEVRTGPADPVDKDMLAFEARRKRGLGFFLARQDIDKRRANRLSDLLRAIPWIEIQIVNGETVIQMRRARGTGNVTMTPPSMPRDTARGEPDRAADRTMPQSEAGCPLSVYVDGVSHETMGTSIDNEIRPDDIEALEAYRGGQVPSQFSSSRADCGVLVLWLRNSSRRSGQH